MTHCDDPCACDNYGEGVVCAVCYHRILAERDAALARVAVLERSLASAQRRGDEWHLAWLWEKHPDAARRAYYTRPLSLPSDAGEPEKFGCGDRCLFCQDGMMRATGPGAWKCDKCGDTETTEAREPAPKEKP